ncbi:hypothetical protein DRO58_01960 [Candidatus Bathyarchaeota archaeon]|nr:MAG: hypothetical protein DRO58_01960 [Candidatus Bathyarchaeota archaeon]
MQYAIETIKLTRIFKVKSPGYIVYGNPGSYLISLYQRLAGKEAGHEIKAVDNVDLRIRRGEFFGLLGPNGSGKSTLLRILACLIYPTSGTAYILGHDIVKERDYCLGLVNYIPGLMAGGAWIDPKLTARSNLEYIAGIFGLSKEKVDEALSLAGLEKFADVRVGTFSTGMSAKLQIAIHLLRETPIFLLDEPTEGISLEAAIEIRERLKYLNRKLGITMVYTTHHVLEAQQLFDRVAIMNQGRIIALDAPRKLIESLGGKVAIEVQVENFREARLHSLEDLGGIDKITYETEDPAVGRGRLRITTTTDKTRDLLPRLVELIFSEGARITYVKIDEPNLEDVFISYVGRRMQS